MPRALLRFLAASVLAGLAFAGLTTAGLPGLTEAAGAAPARAVFMLGDSVMLGSKAAAEKELAGWDLTFDAAVNRSTIAGAQIATARRSEIHDIIVIQLGTNDGGNPTTYATRVDAVMKALNGVPYVVWLTIHEARPYYKSDNDVLRQKATQYPNMRIADWNAVANATPGGMVSDGLHLNATGAVAMAKLVHSTIDDIYANGGGATPATSAPTPTAPPSDPNAVCFAATAPAGTPSTASGRGYWLLDSAGHVFGFGAENLGDLTTLKVTTPPVSIQSTPSGEGYWIVDQKGKVYAFGDAVTKGDMSGQTLNGPVRRLEPTPSGIGYWLLASDGGVFSFGVPFFGSAGARPPNAAVISMASTVSGGGYLMVTARGEVLPFGDATSQGDTKALQLAAPVISLALGASGRGYWLYARDGGVFSFGVPFHGSVPGLGLCTVPKTVALRATDTGNGYWIVTDHGKVYPFGDAKSYGDSPSLAGATVIDMAVRH
ncbi:MAG TPA: hypothetical protein VL916_03960 [Ilumatobacteraceae bacterium]|nr:hypothetical protein [Ilumatobacteraceae bacterium]